jgi:hypothetical protein
MSCQHTFSDLDPGECLRCGIAPGPEWLYGTCGGCKRELSSVNLYHGWCPHCHHTFPPEDDE